jgi:hypothetical protein
MAFAAHANYQSGTLIYCQWWTNRTSPVCGRGTNVTVPLPSLSVELEGGTFSYDAVNSSYVLNFTGLTANESYNATLYLNFTYEGVPFNVSSEALHFWYERDTTGDGLTDWEKIHGWEVTTENASGSWNSPEWVTADPALYSTNGLVNDYVEKEFGLNPGTVDTAGSHMLDTWNLTFDLGPKTQPLRVPTTAVFEYWYESGNSTSDYNWNKSCQYFVLPGSGTCSLGALNSHVYSNITGADSTTWAAQVMWSRSALETFDNLSGVRNASWLRAKLGNSTNQWTLTVEGKLSWGANPLTSSTPSDGIADGARVDPLAVDDIQLQILNWSDSGLSSGDGASIYERAVSPAAPYFASRTDYSGYTVNETASGSGIASYPGTFTATFPVTPTASNASLNLTLVQDHSGHLSSALATPQISMNLLRAGWQLGWYTNGTKSSLGFRYEVLAVLSKATTYLYVPSDNSTLSPLPIGLQKYTGEQNFVLIVLNDTSGTLTQGSVPYVSSNGSATRATYSVSLNPGLNNILIPRSSFERSPFGRTLFNLTNTSINSTTSNGFIRTYWDPASWQAQLLGWTNWNSSGMNDLPGHSDYIKVISNVSQNCSTNPALCGGVPDNPNIESQQPALALQAVITLNITSLNIVDDLLSGLILNRSGNFSGQLVGITSYLPSLGLSDGVYGALANTSYENDGSYGAPVSHPTPPKSWTSVVASVIWNAVSGVVGSVIVVWDATIAAAAYLTDILSAAVAWGLKAENAALHTVGDAILWSMEQIESLALSGILTLFEDGVQIVQSAIASMVSTLTLVADDIANLWLGYYQGNLTGVQASANSSVANFFALTVVLGVSIAALIAIAVVVVSDLTLGTASLIGMLILGIVAVVGSVPNLSQPHTQVSSAMTSADGGSGSNSFSAGMSLSEASVNATLAVTGSSRHSTDFEPYATYNPHGHQPSPAAAPNHGTGGTTPDPYRSLESMITEMSAVSAVLGVLLTSGGVATKSALLWEGLVAAIVAVVIEFVILAIGISIPSSCATSSGKVQAALAIASLTLLFALASVGFLFTAGAIVQGAGTETPWSPLLAILGLGLGALGTYLSAKELGSLPTNCT